MKIITGRLQAFTIMETIIVMVVTAILIAFAYTAYLIIGRSYLSFAAKNKDMQVVVTLDKLLRKDFMQARMITGENHHLFFKTDSVVITYEFGPDYIVRNRGAADTFYVNQLQMKTGFESRQADSTISDANSPVDDLQLTILLQQTKIPYHYHKLYSSEDLFKSNTDAVH